MVVLNTNYQAETVEEQINRSSFDKRHSDARSEFKKKVTNQIKKRSEKINENGAEFIQPDNCKVSLIYEMRTQNMAQKVEKPDFVITSGCNSAVGNVFILVGKTLHTIPDKLPDKIKDTNIM